MYLRKMQIILFVSGHSTDIIVCGDSIRNGKHGATEGQVDEQALPGPVDATEDGLKENSPTKESDGLEDDGYAIEQTSFTY
jgi:hypothetical protein